jgi:hypothetical protein
MISRFILIWFTGTLLAMIQIFDQSCRAGVHRRGSKNIREAFSNQLM